MTSSPGMFLIAGSQPINHVNFESAISHLGRNAPALSFAEVIALALLMSPTALVMLRARG